MKFRELIMADLMRYGNGASISKLAKKYLLDLKFRYIFWLRFCFVYKKRFITKVLLCPIPYLLLLRYQNKLGIHISTNTEIGKGLMIVHSGNIFLHAKSVGENFTVYQGVTVGDSINPNGTKPRMIPKIMNNVTICTNAVVYGDIVLGDFCIIGANSVVNKSVSELSVVAGAPAKVINHTQTKVANNE